LSSTPRGELPHAIRVVASTQSAHRRCTGNSRGCTKLLRRLKIASALERLLLKRREVSDPLTLVGLVSVLVDIG
jgi:hypothetical protein